MEGEADELSNANANADGTSDDAENEGANSANITRFSRGAVDVDAFASAVASRCVSLRDDASAKKATKKKAFVDLLKALPSVGVRSARKAVPESQRSPESWFREPPLAKPAFLAAQDSANVTEAFDAADTYYYRSMARAQRLRDARATCNGDLSARELDQTCGSVEHLLYVLRRQRRSVAAADAAERRFARCVRALDAVKRDVLSSFKNEKEKERSEKKQNEGLLPASSSLTRSFFVLPRQASTFAWLLRQRNSLDTLLSAAKAARLVHKAVANAETVPELRPGGVAAGAAAALKEVEAEVAKARASLDAHVAPSLACDAVFDESKDTSLPNDLSKTSSETSSEERAWRVSACALATGELHATLHANFATINRAREIVEGVFVSAAEANRACHAPNGSGDDASFAPLPGWEPLRALLREGARDAEAYADAEKEQGRLVDETKSETEKALTASASTEASRERPSAEAALVRCVSRILRAAETYFPPLGAGGAAEEHGTRRGRERRKA